MRKRLILLFSVAPLLAAACEHDNGQSQLAAPEGLADASGNTQGVGGSTQDASANTQAPGPVVPVSSAGAADAGKGSGDAGAILPDAAGNAGDAGGMSDHQLDFADGFAWSTEEFEVPAGKERYLCFASTLQEDLVVNAFSTKGQAFVHHLIFSRSTGKDVIGFEDCDTAFRNGWQPLFITGAGNAKLELPNDAGHRLDKGTKLVVQMHLLNFADTAVKGALTINMRRSPQANPRPVSTFIFGSADVRLPPKQKSEVRGECTLGEDVKLIAGFPHMHLLGTSLRFEVGSSPSDMKTVFKRDPFWFDSQTIELLDLELKKGDLTRVTCGFNNTTDQLVEYGESTKNEMCYFIGFAVDRPQQGACLGSIPFGAIIDLVFP